MSNETNRRGAPAEPVLAMDEIQGLAVPGFNKPHQSLIGASIPPGSAPVVGLKQLLRTLAEEVTTAAQALADRRRYRDERRAQGTRRLARYVGQPGTAVAFSARGLRRLTPGAEFIQGEAFQRGLAERSALLGDPTEPGAEGHADNWVVGGTRRPVDVLLVVAGDSEEAVAARVEQLGARLREAGLEVVYVEAGRARPDLPGHEHFGFDDGVSQPGLRGRASQAPEDFLTERTLSPEQTPQAWLYGKPGQELVWPGEFILGYPKSSPDPLVPGPEAQAGPAWTRNGTFLVFRRLRQDVGLFWRRMQQEAERLARQPGFEGMTDDRLAALLVGRWQSGAPVNRVPQADDLALGKDEWANNHFRFDSDTPALRLRNGYVDNHPRAKADPLGATCPWAAHIRKLNVRDSGSDMGGRSATYDRRLLRRGITYGTPLEDRYADVASDPERGNRGLHFLSVQTSIEGQFEFLQARWMNDPARPKAPGGHDVLVGQNGAPGEERMRRCTLFGSGLQQGEVAANEQWVVPTGGEYFFLPSLSALRTVLAG